MQQQKSQDVFLRPSFPGHLLEMSNGCGFHPPHHRHSCAFVHVNLDVQKSSLAFHFLSVKSEQLLCNFITNLCEFQPSRMIYSHYTAE